MRTRSPAGTAIAFVAIAVSHVACADPASTPTHPANLTENLSPSLAKGGNGNGNGTVKVRSVTVTPASATLAIDATIQLTATATPTGSVAGYIWTSSNTAVATVDGSGLVRGVGAGTATIRATASNATNKSGTATITVGTSPPPPPPGSQILWAVGDIADCTNNNDEATARILDGTTGTVAVLGDNAYPNGSASDYANCYEPTWGRHVTRTMPTPGNHEYQTLNASGYFGYFGEVAGDPSKGYYSYDLGDWHIVVLNSSASCFPISCAPGSPQEQWLRADLAATTKACTLAYWHHPRFNSGASHGNNTAVQPLWQALYDYDADVILNGHEHIYERFAPQTPTGGADPARGIRQFTVGTGGRGFYSMGTIKPNSEVRDNSSFGVLKLTLAATSYSWEFVPIAGHTFTDSGTGSCH
jgi:hypothetical protein